PALGTLLATGCIGLMTNLLSLDQFLAWGWRIPLLSSVVLVGFGVWIRLSVDETPMFKELEESGAKAKTPIVDVLRLFGRRLLIAGGVRVGSDVHYALIAVVTEQFPTRVRYAGSSLAYTLAGIVGGAFAPLTMASLLQVYRTTTGISWYIEGTLCVTLVALLFARETAKSPLEQ